MVADVVSSPLQEYDEEIRGVHAREDLGGEEVRLLPSQENQSNIVNM